VADQVVQLVSDAANTGRKVDCSELVVGANTVERQRIVLSDDSTAAALAKVQNAAPGATDYGLTVRTPAEATVAAGTAPGKSLLGAGQFLASNALLAMTTGQCAALQTDAAGVQKVGKLPLGTILTAGANVAAAANNQTLTSAANKLAYLAGFAVTGLGATAAASITITTTGLATNLSFVLPIPAGATVGVSPLVVQFDPPLPASAVNTNIVLNVPSFGAGNTTASASAWGFLV
jgi:hypothetical protein